MAARHGHRSPPHRSVPEQALDGEGEQVTTSPYPVVDPEWGWELNALPSVTTPGLTIRTHADDQAGTSATCLAHPDGSRARATGTRDEPAHVHQAGPRRLRDILDDHRHWWLTHGYLPCAEPEPASNQTAPATWTETTGTPPSSPLTPATPHPGPSTRPHSNRTTSANPRCSRCGPCAPQAGRDLAGRRPDQGQGQRPG